MEIKDGEDTFYLICSIRYKASQACNVSCCFCVLRLQQYWLSIVSVCVMLCQCGKISDTFFSWCCRIQFWLSFVSDGFWWVVSVSEFPPGRRNSWKQNDLSRTSRRRGTNGRRWTTGTQRHKTSMNKSYNLVASVTLGWGWLHLCTRYEIRIQCTHFQGSQKCNFDRFWIQQSLGR
jgi:hypothetical protein